MINNNENFVFDDSLLEEKAYIADTNILLDELQLAVDNHKVVLIATTRQELDKHKIAKDEDLKFKARKSNRFIFENYDKFIHDVGEYNPENILGYEYSKEIMDNRIVACAYEKGYGIITNDLNLYSTAKSFGIDVITYDDGVIKETESSTYSGVLEIYVSKRNDEDNLLLAKIYTEPNPLNMITNEYLIIWDKDTESLDEFNNPQYDLVDTMKFDGTRLVKLKYKPTEDRFMGKTKPINIKQRLAFDMLQDKDIVGAMIIAKAGAGKDYIIGAHLMQKLQQGDIDKVILVRNIEPMKDAYLTGYLTGDLESKMKNWVLPMSDCFGGQEALELLIQQDKVEIQHFESIRGRSFKNCGVWVTEMQSMSEYHAKVLVSRMGENSYLYVNGDIKQTDSSKRKNDSAINTFKKLRGNKMFGMVTLDRVERSDFAALSELM